MTRFQRGWLKLKDTLTAIEKVFLGLAAAGAVFLGVVLIQYFLYPAADYTRQADQAFQQAAQLREENEQTRLRLEEEAAAAERDLSDADQETRDLQEQLDAQLQQAQERQDTIQELEEAIAAFDSLPEDILALRTQYGEKIRQLEDMINAGETDVKICYLTFDDGPTNITQQFLEALDELDIYATFFTIGANTAQNMEENLRAEMMGGHTVANHTYSHQYKGNVYSSLESFMEQVKAQDDWVYETTGFHTDIFRFPSGSQYCKFREEAIEALAEAGYGWIDWSANAYDSGTNLPDAATEAANISYQVRTLDIAVVLCHDWNYNTLEAVKQVVPKLEAAGYVFLPLLPQSSTIGNTTSNFG